MTHAVPRISLLFGAILALAACGTTASPSATPQASAPAEARQPDAIAVVCDLVPEPFDPGDIDLTGPWAGDDGGIYYLRQVGSVLWWNGMSNRERTPLGLGREWNNVGHGVINGLDIEVEWSDVPRGEILNNGTLNLHIQDDGAGNIQIVKVGDEGKLIGDGPPLAEFGNEVWTRCSPVELGVDEYVRTYGGDPRQFAVILTLHNCDDLADMKGTVTTTLNTADAGSPEFRTALGYSNAISERQLALGC